jgi:hypothetical protein
MRMKRWDSPKRDNLPSSQHSTRSKPLFLYNWFEQQLNELWPETCGKSKACEKINQVLASLWLMIGFRTILFQVFFVTGLAKKVLNANDALTNSLANLCHNLRYWKHSRAGKRIWIRIRTKKKHRERSSKRWSRTIFLLATVYNIDE